MPVCAGAGMPFDDQPAGARLKNKPTGKKSTGAESVLKMVTLCFLVQINAKL